jgi:nucleoside-diphosphate-sugar epimerase
VRILVLGGTRFLGSFFAEQALARGHAVTVLHRGVSNVGEIASATRVLADRRDGHALLAGQTFDVVVDTSGYTPGVVGDAARTLVPSVERYVFVSSISAYADSDRRGLVEDDALLALPPEVEAVATKDLHWTLDLQYYGGLKAAAERAVMACFGPQRTTIVRPGLIVGPRDPSYRFVHWVERLATAERVLAPAPADAPVQVIDARDLAAFMLGLVQQHRFGSFNATGDPIAMSTMLASIADGVQSRAALTWVAPEFLDEHGVEPWTGLPLWLPVSSGAAGINEVSNARARAAGLSQRRIEDTARDTLAWLRALAPEAQPKRSSLAVERERELLALWDARSEIGD